MSINHPSSHHSSNDGSKTSSNTLSSEGSSLSKSSLFLTTLLGKYREFEGVLRSGNSEGKKGGKKKMMGDTMNTDTHIGANTKTPTNNSSPEMLAYEVREKALSILAEISGIVSARSEGRKYQGKEGEERMTRVLSRFLAQNPQAQEAYREELGIMGKKKITKTIPTMDDLLDEIGVSVGEILSESQSLIPDIYRTSAKGGKGGVEGEDQEGMEVYNGIITGSGNGMEEVRVAPKYEIVMQVLSSLGIDPRNVSVTTESINPERMRKHPYKIVHIIGENVSYPITLTVSDEIGQSSYIYPGYVDLGQFIEAKKRSVLSGIVPEEVVYSENYRERMAEVIGRMLRGEEGFGKRKSIEGKKRGKENDVGNIGTKEGVLVLGEEEGRREGEQDLVTNLTPEILRNQAILLSHREALEEAKILEKKIGDEMVWCFDEAKGNTHWPRIKGKSLGSFPNSTFNKAKEIGGKDGRILSPSELAKMFEALGLRVATEEEYIFLWREELLSHREALKEAGILEKKIGNEMIWCFDEVKGCPNWPEIGGKSLQSFPNQGFNRARGIGNTDGIIQNPQELAKMFEALGLRVATEEEYIFLWREELLSHREALKEAGILEKKIGNEMIWCFDEVKGCPNWPNIGRKGLKSFPNAVFNKTKGIGNEKGQILSSQQLAKMFEVLGLRVATEEEYIFLWREELLSHREALKEAGILEKKIGNEMIWCFDETKGYSSWLEIGGKSLRSFPNQGFNRERKFGDKTGTVRNPQELAKMFEVLGLRVATEEEYIFLWREELLSHREALKEAGILEKKIGNEMIWCFDEVKGCPNWPNIGRKGLKSFPNQGFNRERKFGDKTGTVRNPQELAKMFEVLGLRVKHPEKR